MGKNLTHNNGDTREVLFEKYERYYYKTHKISNGEPICIEDCLIKLYPIGSKLCQYCIHNKAFDTEKEFIICKKRKQAIKQ